MEEMKLVIAVPYENGQIFQHFGHAEEFKLYEIEDGRVIMSAVVTALGSGHDALAAYLKDYNVDVLICGGIGDGAKTALKQVEISLFGGVEGDADKAVEDFLAKKLNYIPDSSCGCSHHHDEEHNCGSHDHGCNCGVHDCSSHGCGFH